MDSLLLDALAVEDAVGVGGCESTSSILLGSIVTSFPFGSDANWNVLTLESNGTAETMPFVLKFGIKAYQ